MIDYVESNKLVQWAVDRGLIRRPLPRPVVEEAELDWGRFGKDGVMAILRRRYEGGTKIADIAAAYNVNISYIHRTCTNQRYIAEYKKHQAALAAKGRCNAPSVEPSSVDEATATSSVS